MRVVKRVLIPSTNPGTVQFKLTLIFFFPFLIPLQGNGGQVWRLCVKKMKKSVHPYVYLCLTERAHLEGKTKMEA